MRMGRLSTKQINGLQEWNSLCIIGVSASSIHVKLRIRQEENMTEKHIIKTIFEITGIPTEEITSDSHLFDELDVDSLDMAQITLALENHYGIDLADDAVSNIATVQDLVELITAHVKA